MQTVDPLGKLKETRKRERGSEGPMEVILRRQIRRTIKRKVVCMSVLQYI